MGTAEAAGARLAEDCLARADAAARAVAPESAAIEAGAALSETALAALHANGLFRLMLPGSLGGAALDPARMALVCARLAEADASAAWCVGQAAGCAMSAAFLAPGAARDVFGPADAVLAWGAGAQGTARPVEGGYRVDGHWKFASGGRHATWLGGHCRVVDADGRAQRNADGAPRLRTLLFPRAAARIDDDWQVMGLRGTRSEGYAVEDLFVPAAFSLDREDPAECRSTETAFLFPVGSVYAGCFSGVALGVARALLDELVRLAADKTPRGARAGLRENADFHSRLARLEARHGAAAAYQQAALRQAWSGAEADGAVSMDARIAIRLACTHAIQEAGEVGMAAFRLAGAGAIFEAGPFERRLRDLHAVGQQVQGRHTHYETVGRHLMGLDFETMFV